MTAMDQKIVRQLRTTEMQLRNIHIFNEVLRVLIIMIKILLAVVCVSHLEFCSKTKMKMG